MPPMNQSAVIALLSLIAAVNLGQFRLQLRQERRLTTLENEVGEEDA